MPEMPKREDLPAIPYAAGGYWTDKFPLLLGYMVDPVWPDGSTRKPGRLFIALENGSWQVTLKEPSQGLILRVSVDTPDEMFAALEASLRLPKPPWVVDPWEQVGQKKKR